MAIRTEADFFEWLSAAIFYIGYNRYGYTWGHGFMVATRYSDDAVLADAVDTLSAGDYDASEARDVIVNAIKTRDVWCAVNENPAIAMNVVVEAIKDYYFNVLNKEA